MLALALFAAPAAAQPAQSPPPGAAASATPQLAGRVVEQVRVIGNATVPTASILNLVRTRPGERYDPQTVEEDYQRIHRELRKFSNVTALAEPTATGGVVVVFEVEEQKQVRAISFRGNAKVDRITLRNTIELHPGEAIDTFRIRLAENAVRSLYRSRGYPFARVTTLPGPLAEAGEVVFDIVEGPNVRVRNIEFKGNRSFDDSTLRGKIKTQPWMFIFRPGHYDAEQVEQDMALVRRFYEGHGFFDVRVGRKLIWSPDQSDLQINFLIEEGPRYRINRLLFEGNAKVPEAELRKGLRLTEGKPFRGDLLERDRRQIVQAYSPLGYIYQEGGYDPRVADPDYFYVEPKRILRPEPGKVDLLYSIHEGKPFRVGQIRVKGNYKTKDNVVLRAMRFAPGELYNAAAVREAQERVRALGQGLTFDYVNITPIGDDPVYRDLLVEVLEGHTATFNVMAGINSNGGLGGGITFAQRNFDIGNWPTDWKDVFSDRALTGAGQTFRATFEPGTIATNASVFFAEPYLFDTDYSFSAEALLRDRKRLNYDDRRAGGRVSFGRRFGYNWTAVATFRSEDVRIDNIDEPHLRPPEFIAEAGHNTLTSVALEVRRDTRNPGPFKYRGSQTTGRAELYGALGGDYHFQKFEFSWERYFTLHEDLTGRKTVLALDANAGYITGDSVFFERFYGGGLGSVRGFQFRGISPRSGLEEDPIGGDFALTGTAEVSFPLVGDVLRGVVFTDVGTVERELEIGTIRSSVGAGFRLVLPMLGSQMPLAVDFGFPLTKGDGDDTQVISFSFGFSR